VGPQIRDRAFAIPTYDNLMNPTLQALRALGGSGTVREIFEKAVQLERLPEKLLAILHDPNRGSQTAVEYRLACARTYLKQYGLLDNSSVVSGRLQLERKMWPKSTLRE